jgi:hypothetical protein
MTKPDNCQSHGELEYKTNISMKLLGANLLGVLITVAMVGWALAKGMPEMESRLVAQINTLSQRVAKLESWQRDCELRDIAGKEVRFK